MRRPNAASGRNARRDDPDCARSCFCRTRTMKETDGGEAREEAHNTRKDDEAPVMLCRKTGKNSEHVSGARCGSPVKYSGNVFLRLIHQGCTIRDIHLFTSGECPD